ncbi:hypothetical protein B9Z55_025056 [Caenorhabditis nigoni]|nr:hypothetical protein B9Z55_025056 [Caenorhabditis nigoni]
MVLDTDGNRNRSNETETGVPQENEESSGRNKKRFRLCVSYIHRIQKVRVCLLRLDFRKYFQIWSKQSPPASAPRNFSYSSSDESSGPENESYTEDSESEYESARIAPIYPAPDRPPGILTTSFQSEEGNASSSLWPNDAVRRQQSSVPRNVVIPPLLVSETLNNLHEKNNVSQSPPPAYDRLPQLQLSTDSSPPSDSGPVEVPPLDTIKSRLENHLLMLDYSKKSNQPGSEGFDQMMDIYKEIILTILYMEEGMTPQEVVYNLEIATHFVYDRLNDLEESEENKLILTVYKVMNKYLKENKGTVAFNMLVLELLHLEKIIRQKSKEEYAEIERNLFSDIVLC